MNKTFFLVLILIILCSSVFATSTYSFQEKRYLAVNHLFGNYYRVPLMLGSYNTGIVIMKDNPLDSFWYACFPINNQNYSHRCSVCGACNQ